MSNTKEVSVKVGPGFTGLLTLLFIALKLTGFIAWSWLWVLSPLWIGLAVAISITIFALIVAGLAMRTAFIIDKCKR